MTTDEIEQVIDALELAHLSCRPDFVAFPHIVAALAIMRSERQRKPAAWLRVSNISGAETGVFLSQDVQLRTERLEPLYK